MKLLSNTYDVIKISISDWLTEFNEEYNVFRDTIIIFYVYMMDLRVIKHVESD